MAEFFGLLISLIVVMFAVLPILTFIRIGRISRELEHLRQRVAELESAFSPRRGTSAADASAVATPSHASSVGDAMAGVPYGQSATVDEPRPSSVATPTTAAHGPTASAPPLSTSPLRHDFDGADAPRVSESVSNLPEEDLEERIGGRGLLYTGILVLLFGVSFFLKYAFDNAWINETGRVVLGAVLGAGLVGGGLRLAARELASFGHALSGTGFAILYLVIYVALNFYGLVNDTAAFLLMTLVTLSAAVVADRQRAQALAFIAVGGGFLTPWLVGGEENAQLTLFSYLALLVSGTLILALRHRWLALNVLSYIATLLIVMAWAERFYSEAQWLRTLLFLTLFCVLFLVMLRETNRDQSVTARIASGLLATAPLFYHIVAIIITARHPPAIHIYLIAFSAAGLWLTAEPHRPLLRLIVLLGAFAPMLGTLTLPDGLSWTVPNVVAIAAVAALHILAILDRVLRQEHTLQSSELITLHLTGLGLFALLYTALQPAYPELRGALAGLLALGAVGLWRWVREHDPQAGLNAAALAFTLGAIGLAVQFDGPTVVIGWAAEGAAATWLGLRSRRHAFQFGGLFLWVLSVVRLIDGFSDTPANFTVLLNARSAATLFVVVLGYALAWMFSRSDAPEAGRARTGLHVVISVLTLLWVTAEIKSFWDVRYLSAQAHLYEQMMLSLAWGIYGALLIVLGMRRRYAPVRYIGMIVLGVTILKVFFYDLWELGGIYRVIGFLGFGVLLVLVSYLYQKRRAITPPSSAPRPSSDATTP